MCPGRAGMQRCGAPSRRPQGHAAAADAAPLGPPSLLAFYFLQGARPTRQTRWSCWQLTPTQTCPSPPHSTSPRLVRAMWGAVAGAEGRAGPACMGLGASPGCVARGREREQSDLPWLSPSPSPTAGHSALLRTAEAPAPRHPVIAPCRRAGRAGGLHLHQARLRPDRGGPRGAAADGAQVLGGLHAGRPGRTC